jgi:hypothetical protein
VILALYLGKCSLGCFDKLKLFFAFVMHMCKRFKNVFLKYCCSWSFRGSLEGKREQKSYKAVLEDPMLKFSGLYQETCSDLYVTCQVFAEGKPLALPVRTSYKAFSTRWK